MKIGYVLASEEFSPRALIDQAKRAEQAGFHALWISDHYHPWNDEQGHSGEALNEHILGDRWPEADVRLELLEEAVEVIRTLWQGGQRSHHGRHYTVENARVYDLPDPPPRILVSGFGPKAIELAARIGDGFATTAPDADAIATYRDAGGTGPVHAGTKVCYGRDEAKARATAHRLWPNEALPGELAQVLPTPAHFEQACELVTPDQIQAPVGPDLDAHAEALRAYEHAGVDELFVQQIGPEQERFFDDWAPAVLRRF
ncbi:MAG TPA: TIGR03557 family F420-dependent LLM class oxidoreductase [Solirubrobacter sp.]|nr:TIGR03557 family F420-dependent LLM class oxidoreductase [Solirubrobacter sp.]